MQFDDDDAHAFEDEFRVWMFALYETQFDEEILA